MTTKWKPSTYGDYLLIAEWKSIVKTGTLPHLPPGYKLSLVSGKPKLVVAAIGTGTVRVSKSEDPNEWGRFAINTEKQSA